MSPHTETVLVIALGTLPVLPLQLGARYWAREELSRAPAEGVNLVSSKQDSETLKAH